MCEGRQLKASMTGKLARLEAQEQQVISSNTLRISKKRGQENNNDSNTSDNIKRHKEGKKTPYGANYRPLVLPEKIVQTGDKVQQKETKVVDNNTDDKETKKEKKNKKRKRSEIESTEEKSSNSKNNVSNTKTTKNKNSSDISKTTDTKATSNAFFFNYDNENKKLEESKKDSKPRPASIEDLYSDGTERMSKSAKRKAKKQRTK